MKIQTQITDKLTSTFTPDVLDVINESHMHSGPAMESHFKVVIVSDAFNGKRLIGRHRLVNECLAKELAEDIHALAMHTYTPEEWVERKDSVPLSPNCLGGSKKA
ncbi:BolA/IbaG family iron-sulfur metabolism protein [Catenovulum sp. SM1970]|uniref:BolA family protein n=1 Tax=Marinifaba aquimaris TaxID=2741323 RepID=UPI0015722F70|nr:BolA/IbaG family iron-sulfur metabolism protein [Marinifaba aquimaris]NTS77597.1 BolA/IbaG family iron-sulfur metabolism protein [Marinifaba aquimaris]